MDSKKEETHFDGTINDEGASMGSTPMSIDEDTKMLVGIENAHLWEELTKMKMKITMMENWCDMLRWSKVICMQSWNEMMVEQNELLVNKEKWEKETNELINKIW